MRLCPQCGRAIGSRAGRCPWCGAASEPPRPEPSETPATQPLPPASRRRHLPWWIVIGAGLVVFLVVASFLSGTRDASDDAGPVFLFEEQRVVIEPDGHHRVQFGVEEDVQLWYRVEGPDVEPCVTSAGWDPSGFGPPCRTQPPAAENGGGIQRGSYQFVLSCLRDDVPCEAVFSLWYVRA